MQRRMLSLFAATGLGLALAVSTASPSSAAVGSTVGSTAGSTGSWTGRATAPEQCRTLDFDKAAVTPVASTGSVPPTVRYLLTVSGSKPATNVRVTLVPLTYVKQPAYWGIVVTGCSSGVGLPVLTPYTVTADVTSTVGSCGIQVIGATRSRQIDLAGCSPIPLAGTRWVLDPASLGVPLPTGITITANFSASTVSGSSACNTYQATYTTDATGTFTLGPVMMTIIGCDPVTTTAESTYLKRLRTSTQVQVTSKELLLSAGGQTLLRFTPAAPQI